LPALSATGVSLSITYYWAIIAGSYTDYIAGKDLTANGGVTLVTDHTGSDTSGAFQTDGSTGYASAPSGIYFPAASFSITLWAYQITTSFTMFDFTVDSANDHVEYTTSYPSFCSTGSMVHLYSGGVANNFCTTSQFPTGVWTHLAITYDYSTTTVTLYINGVSVDSANSLNIRGVTRTINYFGRDSYNNWGNWKLDEIKIHSRVLTATEVLRIRITDRATFRWCNKVF
jgi:hypothetical protein